VETKKLDLYLDEELLQSYFDSLGKAIVEQMFSLYCQQVEIYLKDIESAQLNDSLSEWQDHCHKMKGASASVGMCLLHGKLNSLEKTDDAQEQKAIYLKELRECNKQSIHSFNHWLETK
jgi:HPt (histidine-containing phosphotransfer) domain-containing protein